MRAARAFAAATLFALGAHAAEPVAFVADLKGEAALEGSGKLRFLAELAPGARLLLGTGAVVAVTYASTGNEFTARGPGEYLVGPAELKAEKGASPVRREVAPLRGSGAVADAVKMAGASVRMRAVKPAADGGALQLQFPVDTRVATLQPTFLWQGQGDFALTDAQGKPLWKAGARQGSARPDVKLQPGTRYRWSVNGKEGRLAEASFETLSHDDLARATRAKAAAKTFPDRVMHTLLLQEAGATQEARESWAQLARERPDLPEIAAFAH